jgi:hypothetical protein
MPMQRYSDQQVSPTSRILNSLRLLNPPILEDTYYLLLPLTDISQEQSPKQLEKERLCLPE